MALHLARPKRRSLTNPSLCHLLSTFSNHPNSENTTTTDSNSPGNSPSSDNPSLISSYFSDIKAGLKHQSNERPTSPFSRNRTNPSSPTSKTIPMSAFVAEIRKNLSDYRERSAVPPPTESSAIPSQSRPHISFQEIYKRNASAKQGDSNVNPASSGPGRKLGFETIRESLGKIKKKPGATNVEEKTGPFWSLSHYKESFKLKPSEGNVVYPVIGGTELPKSVFGREMTERTKEGEAAMKTEFVKMYSYGELGMRLKQLRPERKGGEGWFSLQELNERLMKLREMDSKESESRIGEAFKDLRKSLYDIKRADDEKQKRTFIQRIDILDHLGRTPNFMLRPPKEHLVEKYFHPDNMSSAEKLKIELAKVRDEFKMSESDCGSARVQVAQLTTKIKHLSSVLHKKDKHSRKGLIAMVQKRKKLLKYLRRTDWDSYCLVLSKLGLRDNPDYKN
ncbi:Structural constituent of ribosome, putative [Theobroma cacao]|uniref:Small ribosomal subunit protein uS15c n=1 Tax=Theobroma cacao TaxID=3641 RepID=A0A061G9Z2_THECC|nr:Structural constituent of ribosome, putative [Theobroma cacao]